MLMLMWLLLLLDCMWLYVALPGLIVWIVSVADAVVDQK